MSFGFGAGDIVLFINFAVKVASSLGEECGAKAEYQDAELQCRGFMEIMNEIQALDLTSLPKQSRDRIERHSAHTHDFVGAFKERILKYERAMGKSTKRGWAGSVPRKVQWAFDAADDLARFRDSLVPLVQLVHVEISASTQCVLIIVFAMSESNQLQRTGHKTYEFVADTSRSLSSDLTTYNQSHRSSSGAENSRVET